MNFKPFSHEIIQKALNLNRPFIIAELGENEMDPEDLLDNSGLFFCNFDSCGTKTYISKQLFFDSSVFTVHFTKDELKNKFLTAPIRFFPFTQKSLPLFIDGKEVKLKKRKLSLRCLEDVYQLDHGQQLIKHLNESSENTLLTIKSLQNVALPVYDFSEFTLSPGDHLKITLCKDRLNAEVFNSEDINLQSAQAWCEQFEKSLLSVLREFGPFNDFYSQIELAYFYGRESLRRGESIALRDFFNLSKKIVLVDFIFQKIIWFKNNDPSNSPEAQKRLAAIKTVFADKVEVSSEFYVLLNQELQAGFITDSPGEQSCNEKTEVYKTLKRSVLRVALWIVNYKTLFHDPEMPANEILMFEAAFNEFQFLCSYYFKNSSIKGFSENFEEALELNFEILMELMDFLREYYYSL